MAQEEVKLSQILGVYEAVVVYVPLSKEVQYADLIDCNLSARIFPVSNDKSVDPLFEARRIRDAVCDLTTAILLPGREFDSSGTRHGRGGGWYDRFLPEVPTTWTRIGICRESQFCEVPLTREAWDQPVDKILIVSNDRSRIHAIDATPPRSA